MKKKRLIIGVFIAIALIVIIGNKIHAVHEENVARDKFLEWLSFAPEDIESWGAMEPSESIWGGYITVELKEEQKEAFCSAMKSIVHEEVTIGENASEVNLLSLSINIVEGPSWVFNFDGEAVYVTGTVEVLDELYGEWPWEIRNAELNKCFSDLLNQ